MTEGIIRICGTPIGNLGDVSDRLRRSLETASVIAAEDTRQARILLAALGIGAPEIVSMHDHNEAQVAPRLVERARSGAIVCVTTDAGMPSVADPGRTIVDLALEASVRVEVIPGPSAVETALAASGLAADGYVFVGFLPRRPGEIDRALARADRSGLPVVAFETARRLPGTLGRLAASQPSRRATICRELTKLHEEVVRASLEQLATRFATAPRGEVVIVLEAAREAPRDEPAGLQAGLSRLVEHGLSRRDAAVVAAELTGLSRRSLYQRLLADADRSR